MKILQINSVCGIGSTGRIATDLYKFLEEKGHGCKIGYGRKAAPQGIDSIKIGSKLDNYMEVLKTRIFDIHSFGCIKSTKKFIKEVKEYDPDIIHLHNIHGYYLNIEILFKYLKEAKKPIIWTLHDCWAFTGHCAYFDFVECEKWKTGCEKCPQKSAYPTSKFIDNSKSNYKKKKEIFTSIENITIVTPSKWLANLVKESFLGKYDIKVINNGIDLSKFKKTKSNFREKYNLEDKFIILGVASVWDERKGLRYFVELNKLLNDEYKIVLVGVDENQQSQLTDNIISITRTNNVEELAQIYTAADVFVNPTLEDNYPTTNLEAIACETNIITFDTGGSPEIIKHLNEGIVEKGNIEKLKLTIEKYKNSNMKIYENLKKDIDYNYSCEKYFNLYDSLIFKEKEK